MLPCEMALSIKHPHSIKDTTTTGIFAPPACPAVLLHARTYAGHVPAFATLRVPRAVRVRVRVSSRPSVDAQPPDRAPCNNAMQPASHARQPQKLLQGRGMPRPMRTGEAVDMQCQLGR